ncbi:50S ribosomal protein L25 [Cohnella endophytica]|uniref:Large ribosomal subunit protein bL25 n=1 Tax=Cohnella endophytica TaxID=2419778 RepID=A0A494X419_9BACL|nr:50S ribosomal protein L25 [Cohnella endophytica]RKP45448.1 50S ribosomal protein L25 [Cohnella endophytica]
MSSTLQVQARQESTKGELRRIRSAGQVPGVVYGKGLDSPARIVIDGKDLAAVLRSQSNSVIEIDVPGAGKQPVMLSDLQRDPISRKIMHIDFHRIDMNQKVTTAARLDITGVSPGEKEGGMLQLVAHEVEIECYPKDIPDTIRVDVSQLGVGDHLTIGELKFPEGVVATQDPETVIVAVLAPQKERTEEELDAMDDKAEEDRKHSEAATAVDKG